MALLTKIVSVRRTQPGDQVALQRALDPGLLHQPILDQDAAHRRLGGQDARAHHAVQPGVAAAGPGGRRQAHGRRRAFRQGPAHPAAQGQPAHDAGGYGSGSAALAFGYVEFIFSTLLSEWFVCANRLVQSSRTARRRQRRSTRSLCRDWNGRGRRREGRVTEPPACQASTCTRYCEQMFARNKL